MILEDLRQATRGIHEDLESRLPLGRPDLALEDYRELVRRFHGFVVPLEHGLLVCPGMGEGGFNYEGRFKEPALEQDVTALGLTGTTELAGAEDLPPLETREDLYGCLYVMEGSTLGGQVISRSLREHLGITPETGSAYFSGYGPQTGPRWKEFLGKLAEISEQPDTDREAITRSAVATFHALDRWLFREASPHPASASSTPNVERRTENK